MSKSNHLISYLRGTVPGTQAFLVRPDGQTETYETFFTGAERIAAALTEQGLQIGDRVAVQAPKTPEMLQLYLGTVMAGGVFLPLNTAYTGAELAYFITDAEPRFVVCAPEAQGDIAPLCPAGTHLLTLAADGSGTLSEAADGQPGFQAVARADGDLAAILYTSGTTGRSKGAMLSHGNLASNTKTLRHLWQFTDQDVLIHALPIFHTHGLFVATNIVLASGAQMLFHPNFDAERIVADMPRATTLMGVPTFYTRLLDTPGLAEAARGMRLFVSGSAPLLAETHDQWQAVTGHAILERYGMTETNMSTSNPYDGDRRAGTVGLPLPDVALRIADPDTGANLPRGEIGSIEVKGPNVFQGYWRMPEKTAEEHRADGFFITGDLGRIDDAGYVTLVGRAKDLIISGGLNVYPKEVEEVIDAQEGVFESAVIGVPHHDLGEAVIAVVVPSTDTLDKTALCQALKGQLARFKQPKDIILLEALPRNTMGKVQKAQLRADYAALFRST